MTGRNNSQKKALIVFESLLIGNDRPKLVHSMLEIQNTVASKVDFKPV